MDIAFTVIFDKGFAMIANGRHMLPTIDAGLVLQALKRGVRQELKIHKALGNPIAIGRDGKVVWIPADQIQIDDEGTAPSQAAVR